MTSGVFLSITAPAYNERENIEKMITYWESIFAHDGIQGEIVIGEDGSTDGTKDILRETVTISTGNEGYRALDEETSLRNKGSWSLTIPKNNPANTYMKAFAEYSIVTAPSEIKIITQALTIGSLNKYHHIVEVEGRVNDRPHFNKTWEISIPRKLS